MWTFSIWFLLHVSPTSLILETYGDFISRVRVRYKVISIILVSWYVKEEPILTTNFKFDWLAETNSANIRYSNLFFLFVVKWHINRLSVENFLKNKIQIAKVIFKQIQKPIVLDEEMCLFVFFTISSLLQLCD